MLYLFLVQRPCATLFLHSFPTRRSSDLAGRDVVLRRQGQEAHQVPLGERQRRSDHRDRLLEQDQIGVGARRGGLGDRKSTRLNSSHQIISYAVFCLKKKNKKI